MTFYLLISILLLTNDSLPAQETRDTNEILLDPLVTKNIEPHSLDGYWILSDYIDNIFKDKAIGKHRLYKASLGSMTLEIQKDSLTSLGLLFAVKKIKINPSNDTLGILDNIGEFIFKYNKETDIIEAIELSPSDNKTFTNNVYTFRRVTEKYLLDILVKKDPFIIRNGFYQLFIDSLFAGEYESINTGQKLTLTSTGLMIGFKNYNKYEIHDYFGTFHPFQNLDAICFEDTTDFSSEYTTRSSKQLCFYNWAFLGDTLTLTEMLTNNHFEYYLGNQTYIFIKTQKRNH